MTLDRTDPPAAPGPNGAAGGPTGPPPRAVPRSELGMAALLVALGAVVLAQTATVRDGGPSVVAGPRFFPALVGILLLVAGLLLAVEVLRGRVAEPEAADGADPRARTDWRTLGLLGAALAVHALLLVVIGYVLAVAALFAGAAAAFGSRRTLRDAAVGVVLGLVIYVAFTRGLALSLPRGPLERLLSPEGLL